MRLLLLQQKPKFAVSNSQRQTQSYSRLKGLLHRCDRAMIYIFIAGAYTPWLHLKNYAEGGWSNELRWAMWVFALVGIVYQQGRDSIQS